MQGALYNEPSSCLDSICWIEGVCKAYAAQFQV